ncbi:hypothetical protein Vretimale_12585 [Volvox reticuliferus]|uniref:Uncharacterized protein n=1 Tax=Volvox reticuliferus TaxID=1737510 RepID=A0A8J4GJQ3_9CHLO|nr:hypothetical protein Vretifemale_136 [Volvox reticuliferus]GIM08659.1 hypothetical protein Vretimale_12585 [Volvox reticuliferus]
MADLPQQRSATLVFTNGSLDHPIELSHDTAYVDMEALHSHVDLAKMPPMPQTQQSLEIQLALEKLEHKISADAHATRRSELRAKQRLLDSLSQPPPPAGQLFASRSAAAAAASPQERIPRPIVLNEILRGLARTSSPGTQSATARPASPPNRSLSPRALHFTGAMPTPARAVTAGGTAAAEVPPAVQRPTHHADPPEVSQRSHPSTLKGSRSPDPLARSQGGRPASPGPKVAATKAAPGRTRPTPGLPRSAAGASPTGDGSPQQHRHPLSPPQVQHAQAQSQSRSHQLLQHRQEEQPQNQRQRPASVEPLSIHRPQSVGRRYMSPGSAVGATAGSSGGSGAARVAAWVTKPRGSSGGGGGARMESAGSRGATPGALSWFPRSASGSNFSSLDHILRGVESSIGGGFSSSSSAVLGQTHLPSSRGGSGGDASGGVSRGRYYERRVGVSLGGGGGSEVKAGMMGHRGDNSSYRAGRPQSAGSLNPRGQVGVSSLFPTVAAAPGQAAAVATAASVARPQSAPRSISIPLTQPTPRMSSMSASAAGAPSKAATTASARWTSGPGSHPPCSHTPGLLSAGLQQPLGSNGGLSRAPPSPSLLPMTLPISRVRSTSAVAVAPTYRPVRPISMHARNLQQQAQLPQSQSVITESLLNHAATAQRLQAQLLKDIIADGAGDSSAPAASPPWAPASRSDRMANSDTEGETSQYEAGGLGLADTAGMPRRWESPSRQHPETGSSVRMVESLLRNSVAVIGSVAETASNGTRTLAGTSPPTAAATARGLPLESPLTVLFSPRVPVPGGSAAPPPPFLASPVQPLQAVSDPRANLMHKFIVPSGPLWPSADSISGRRSSPGLTPDLWPPRQATGSQPTSSRPSSREGQRPLSAGRGDGGGAGGSPLRPQGLAAAQPASSSRGSPAAVAAASSPERAAKGLQALLSFLQQKFELRRERRRAARALEGWRRAAVSSGGGGSGILSPRPLDTGAAETTSAASTRLGRYESPGVRSGNPAHCAVGPTTRPTSGTVLLAASGIANTSSGGGGNGPHSSVSRTGQAQVASCGGAFSPGPASSSVAQAPRGGLQRPSGLSRSAGGATSTSSTPAGPIQVQDLFRQPRRRREHAELVEGERERQQHQRIKQLERELQQARQQQEQLLRQQQQEKHHHQLHQLQQQLQQLQEQLLQHHRQHQEQLDQLHHRQQHPVRALSSEALLRRASTGGSKASAGASWQAHKPVAATEMGLGTGAPPRQASARRARDSSIMLLQPPMSIPSSPTAAAHGSAVAQPAALTQGVAVPTSPSLATRLATYPTSHTVAAMPLAPAVPLAVSSPASSKAAFRDLHQMVSEMERLLIAMNDDVTGAVAAATGSSSGGGGVGAKAGTPRQTFNSVARPTAATPPSQSRVSPPQSPDLRSPARLHGGSGFSTAAGLGIHGAVLQQPYLTATVAPGSRTGSARGSLAASFATAAATPGTIPGGSSGGSTDGSGNAVAGSSRNGGVTIPGAMTSSAATATSTGGATTSDKASSSGGGASGVSQTGEAEGGSSSSGGGATGGKLGLPVKKDSVEMTLDQKPVHVRLQLQGSDGGEAVARAAVPGTQAMATEAVAAALLASANHVHANSSSATDAMSEQLEEMRASIRRIEQEMWGAAVASQSLARGVAAAAAAANAKPMGSPVVRHHPQVVRQQAQPARPYETSPAARGGHLSLGGTHGPNGGSLDGRIVASTGGLDTRTASRGAVRQPATAGGAASVATAAARFNPQADSRAGSPGGSVHTSFSLRDAFLPRDKVSSTAGVGTARGESSTITKLGTRSASMAGGVSGHKASKSSDHGAATAATSGTNPRVPATPNVTTATIANIRAARAAPSSLGGAGVRQVAPPRSSSPSSPRVTRHVDALEAQLLEELGELEDALQKLKHNTGKAMAWSGPGAVGA